MLRVQRDRGRRERELRRGTVRALGLLAVLMVVACMAGKKSALQAGAAPEAMTRPVMTPHDEIEQLSQQIDAKRNQMSLPAIESHAMAEPAPIPPPSGEDPSCHPAANDTCQQSCVLSNDICANAKKICDLAQQLPNDAWADGKCKDATATCSSAHEKCCNCM